MGTTKTWLPLSCQSIGGLLRSGKFYRDTNCITTSPPVSEKWWSVPYEIYVLFFLQSGLKVNSASWQMAAAHEDFDATRGISSHCICTRHIHSLWTRPNLEAVLLVAMVATVDNTAISLALSLWSRVANRRSMTKSSNYKQNNWEN